MTKRIDLEKYFGKFIQSDRSDACFEVDRTYQKIIKIADRRFKNPVFRRRYVRYRYADVTFNKEGWACAKSHLPRSFDIVALRVDCGTKEAFKTINGWWSGTQWEGIRLKKKDEIIQWKRIDPEEYL
jgi:hypothetical protein